MKLIIVCDEPGLRAALAVQFQDHKQPVMWLESGQVLAPQFAAVNEPTLIIDCLGTAGNPCAPWLAQALLTQWRANCSEHEWIWLLLSDSRVFPASSKRRFVETDTATPGTYAGNQLQMRESSIAENMARHIVLRTGPLIASLGDNLLTRLLNQLRSGNTIAASALQRFCPTPVTDVARVVAAIHDQLDCGVTSWGIYHYESSDPVNSFEFAEVVLAAATQYWPLAEKIAQSRDATADGTTEIFPLINCQHIRDTFGIQQLPWRKAIPALLKQIYKDHQS